MSDNGHGAHTEPRKVSLTGEVLSLLEDQIELVSLDLEYESSQGFRKLAAWIVAAMLGMTAFAVLQVALISGLMALGLPLAVSSIILATVYGLGAFVLIQKYGKRDSKVGAPFQATRDEFRKNLRWIRQLF